MEQREDLGFAWREVDGFAGAFGAEFERVDGEIVHREFPRRLAARIRAAEGGADAGEEFVFAEGLADEIVRAELQPHNHVDLLAFRGEKKHGHLRIGGAHAAADLVAVEVRHHDVEAEQIGPAFFPKRERLATVAREERGEALRRDAGVEGVEGDGVVVSEEDFHREGGGSCSCS